MTSLLDSHNANVPPLRLQQQLVEELLNRMKDCYEDTEDKRDEVEVEAVLKNSPFVYRMI